MNRDDMDVSSLVITRKPGTVSSTHGRDRAEIYFGISRDRDSQELFDLQDVAAEFRLQQIEERGEQSRILLQAPKGLTIMRGELEMFASDPPTRFFDPKRTPLLQYMHTGLFYSIWVQKKILLKLASRPDLLEYFGKTDFLPLFRLTLWADEIAGNRVVVATLLPIWGTVMFKKHAELS